MAIQDTSQLAQSPKLLIDYALAQAVVAYLAQRPYAEVYQLIAGLQRLEPLEQANETLRNTGNPAN